MRGIRAREYEVQSMSQNELAGHICNTVRTPSMTPGDHCHCGDGQYRS